MGTFFSFTQIILCTADNYVVTMLYEILDEVFQVQQARTSVYQCYVVYAERSLQQCHFVELVQHYTGVGIAFYVDDDAHTFAVRLVVGIGNALYLLFVGQIGDGFD